MNQLMLLLYVCTLVACAKTSPKPLARYAWSHNPACMLSPGSGGRGYVLAGGGVLLVFDRTQPCRKRLVRLEQKTGRPRWEVTGDVAPVHPTGALDALYVMEPRQSALAAHGFPSPYHSVRHMDLGTGRTMTRVTLQPGQIPAPIAKARFHHHAGLIYFVEPARFGTLDPRTGRILREVRFSRRNLYSSWAPVFYRGLIVFQGLGAAYALSDGKMRFDMRAASGIPVLGTPDGKRLYIQIREEQRWAEIGEDGAVRRRGTGQLVAVTSKYLAVSETFRDPGGSAKGSALVVYRHGQSKPVHRLVSRNAKDFFSAVTFHGRYLVFFRNSDRRIWRVDPATGRSRVLLQVERFWKAGGCRSMAPLAFVGTPPMFQPPYLYVYRQCLDAFRVRAVD